MILWALLFIALRIGYVNLRNVIVDSAQKYPLFNRSDSYIKVVNPYIQNPFDCLICQTANAPNNFIIYFLHHLQLPIVIECPKEGMG